MLRGDRWSSSWTGMESFLSAFLNFFFAFFSVFFPAAASLSCLALSRFSRMASASALAFRSSL